jgi:hypothetical protein
MTYDQTQALFDAMLDLETYSKMYQREMCSAAPDWEATGRYTHYITVARKKIFNLVGASHAE